MPDAFVKEVGRHPEAVSCFGDALRIDCGELGARAAPRDLEACKSNVAPLVEFLAKHPATTDLVNISKDVIYVEKQACTAEMQGSTTETSRCYWYVQARIALKKHRASVA
jgi:hypothetical protein